MLGASRIRASWLLVISLLSLPIQAFAQTTDGHCGALLGEYDFTGPDALILAGRPVEAHVKIYERCVLITTWEPNGRDLQFPALEVPNNVSRPPAPGAPLPPDKITATVPAPKGPVTLTTRIYDKPVPGWPTKVNMNGQPLRQHNGYFKLMEVDGTCTYRIVQMCRLRVSAYEANGTHIASLHFPDDNNPSKWGVDGGGGGPCQGNPQSPEYPSSGQVTENAAVPATFFLLDIPGVPAIPGMDNIFRNMYEDQDARQIEFYFEFRIWVICDGAPVAYWEYNVQMFAQINPDGTLAAVDPHAPPDGQGGPPQIPKLVTANPPTTAEFNAAKADLNNLKLPK